MISFVYARKTTVHDKIPVIIKNKEKKYNDALVDAGSIGKPASSKEQEREEKFYVPKRISPK